MSVESLNDIAHQIEATQKPKSITVRKLLSIVGQARRGKHVSKSLRRKLKQAGLICEPDFDDVHFDSSVELSLISMESRNRATIGPEKGVKANASERKESRDGRGSDTDVVLDDVGLPPEQREVVISVRKGIPSAAKPPQLIRRNEPVFRALSHLNEFKSDQLVVSNGQAGQIEGIFSWQSYGRAILAGKTPQTVGECLSKDFGELHESKPLFDAIREAIRHGVVVIRAKDNSMCGLVTQRDVAEVFVELSEPFLFLGQIENHLREMVDRMRLSPDELSRLFDQRDTNRSQNAKRVDDCSLGELIRAIQNGALWKRLGLNYDHSLLLNRLDRVRMIRNRVMHFDADSLASEDRDFLTETRRILQEL